MNLILVKREGLGMQWGNTVYPEGATQVERRRNMTFSNAGWDATSEGLDFGLRLRATIIYSLDQVLNRR